MQQTENSKDSKDFAKDAETWYNNTKDADGSVKINIKGLKPINDTKHQHEWYLDPNDADSSWVDVWKCKHPDCSLGILTDKV